MEIDIGLFDKLVNIGMLDESNATKILKEKNAVVLDRDTTAQLENGLLVARYLEHTVGLMEQEKVNINGADVSKFAQLKEANTTSAKLFNWNLILKEIDKLGISVDSDSRGLVIAGDIDMILDILKKVDRLEENISNPNAGKDGFASGGDKAKTSTVKKVKEGVDILSMDPNKKPEKSESSLELILNTLCRNFKMKPKQCAALLTNNNQYLMHSVVKGLKGNFEPIITWYEELNSLSSYFAEIICLE